MLQRRVFKLVTKVLGLGDKDFYVTRYNYGTRSIEQGISATSIAYAMAHATAETVIRNYAIIVKLSTILGHLSPQSK